MTGPAGIVSSWLRTVAEVRPGGPRLVSLAYHDVRDEVLFERQLRYIRERFTPVSLDDVVASLSGEASLPRDALLVTFDDAHWTVYERGLPLLRRHGIPGVVFVVAGLVNTDEAYWFDEVRQIVSRGGASAATAGLGPDDAIRRLKSLPDEERRRSLAELRDSNPGERISARQLKSSELLELEEAGVVVGNHTFTHPCLNRCPEASVDREVTLAHQALTGWLGHEPRAFAYPNGNEDERAETTLRRLGYAAGFLFDHRMGRFPPQNPLRISRLRVNSTTAMSRFGHILSGLHPLVHHAIGRR